MIFLWLSPVFLAVNAYYIYEVVNWLRAIERWLNANTQRKWIKIVFRSIKYIFAISWTLASLAIYIAFLIPKVAKEELPLLYVVKRVLKHVGNYHLGVFIYMGMTLLIILICRLIEFVILRLAGKVIVRHSKKFNIRRSVIGLIYVSFIVFITLFGTHKARDIKVTPYEVTVNKSAGNIKDLKIVLVADLHLGYNIGCRQMEKMVGLINKENADLVIVAGDIFDNEFEALDDPENLQNILSSIKSTYGVYATYGNHDISEKIIGGFTFNWNDPSKGSSAEMDQFMKDCGFNLLIDDYVMIEDSLYIYGRPDFERPGKTVEKRRRPDEIAGLLDMSKPVIVMDHEPRELLELSNAGIDLDLCGHTHDGQFFPMNLTSRYFTWENSCGMLVKNDMTNIVTSGVGLFGPNIRIGTKAEICPITVHFSEE